ncbi:MAG: septum formation initiator family protein [Desulfobacterales bacterium]|nr:MAG: septum formation initiator family protein [Desulfobacterales bacterium]
MTTKRGILLALCVLALGSLLGIILFSEQGLFDLFRLRKERDGLVEKNERVIQENRSLAIEIDRLQHDPKFIENVARRELGMIGQDELILKLRRRPGGGPELVK